MPSHAVVWKGYKFGINFFPRLGLLNLPIKRTLSSLVCFPWSFMAFAL